MKALLTVSLAALSLAASATPHNPNPTNAASSGAVGLLPEFTVTASRTANEAPTDGKVGQLAELIVVAKPLPAKKSPAAPKPAPAPDRVTDRTGVSASLATTDR